ncbi:MAG: T9SS type A sorting domain-containing protein [Crocinitomicaceae bacterium]|nr:T9SS type A sorting domain-containing protein [Crocinitomicaceae bacterium]
MIKTIALYTFILIGTTSFASQWEQRANFGANGRHRATAISIGTKGYLGLGHYNGAGPNVILNDWWEYDPGTNSWTQKSDYPSGGGVGDYGVISFGMETAGFVGSGQIFGNEFYKYDPMLNQWIQMSSPSISHSNTQAFVIDNKAYCMNAGGDVMYSYDADLDIWSVEAFRPFTLGYWNSCFSIDGLGYVKTGNTLWQYKASTQQWLQRAPFPGLATGGSVSFVQNGKGYIVSGYGGSLSLVQSEVWEYDPFANTWTQLPDFEGTSRRFASGFSIGNKCFLGTGTNGTNFNDFWQFDALASSVNELNDIGTVNVFPNPASTYTRIVVEKLTQFEVEIYDLTGKLIRKEMTSTNEIMLDRGTLNTGVYFYSILQNGTVLYSNKLIFN